MSKKQDPPSVQELVAKWQDRLGLRDWDIETRVCRYWEIPGCVGTCQIHPEDRTARIMILDPSDIPADVHDTSKDTEHTIVHELLHIHMEPFASHEAGVALEQAINAIASALVR